MKNNDRKERLDEISEALFGAPTDLDSADAVEHLEAAGVDRHELCARMYEKLSAVARSYRLRNEDVPFRLRNALDDLRKQVGPPKTKEEADSRADSAISRLLDSAKTKLPLGTLFSQLSFQASFRHRSTSQSAADRQVIEKLQKELISDLEKEENENRD